MALVTASDAPKKEKYTVGLSGSIEEKLSALDVIGQLGGGGALEMDYLDEVLPLLEDPSLEVRCATVMAIGDIGEFASAEIDKILAILEDPSFDMKRAALFAIGCMGSSISEIAAPEVVAFLQDDDVDLRVAALGALGGLKAWGYQDEVRICMQEGDAAVVVAALNVVTKWGEDGQQLAPDVAGCITHPNRAVRAAAATAITACGCAGERQAEKVAVALLDEDNTVREATVKFFEAAGTAAKKAAPVVAEGLGNKDGRLLAASVMALGYMKAGKYAKQVSGFLSSGYDGDASLGLSLAGVEAKLPTALRRPACAAALALGMMGKEAHSYAGEIAKCLGEDTPAEATACFVKALGLMGTGAKEHETMLREMAEESSPPIREAVCFALGEIGKLTDDAMTASTLAGRLRDSHPLVRKAAVIGLSKMEAEGPPFAEEIVKLFGDKVDAVQIAAVKAMLSLGVTGQLYATHVARKMLDGFVPVRAAAAEVLGDLEERGAAFADELVALLGDPEGPVREAALNSLAKMGDEARPFLKEITAACSDPLESVRAAADLCATALSATE
mmetsp:Transcript_14812/g.30980  ORF Transcript_14812/g.30980 Transcript_14812/m.30980 type:complete len:560 (-) Transcript_14812:60-1739(-)